MDLGKLRLRQKCNIRQLQQLRRRSKYLSLNFSILPQLKSKRLESEYTTQFEYQYHKQQQQADTFKTKQDEIEQQKIKNNKLYQYFVKKQDDLMGFDKQRSTVEKLTKQMRLIYDCALQKYKKRKYKRQKLQLQLHNLYKQNHIMYQRLRDRDKQGPSRKIHWLKQIIETMEDNMDKIKAEEEALKIQIVNYLRNLLKCGFCHTTGVSWMLRQLLKFSYYAQNEDFPDYLDDKSQIFLFHTIKLLKYYLHSKTIQMPTITTITKISASSTNSSKFERMTAHNRLKRVYSETKDYIRDWVSQSKQKQTIVKNIEREQATEKGMRLQRQYRQIKQNELKRLKKKYPKQKYELMVKYLFGKSTNNHENYIVSLPTLRKSHYTSLITL